MPIIRNILASAAVFFWSIAAVADMGPLLGVSNGAGVIFLGPSCVQSGSFLVNATGMQAQSEIKYDTLICGLVTDSIYSKLDVLYIFAAPTMTIAKENLIVTGPAQFTGSITAGSLVTSAVASGTPTNGQTIGDFNGEIAPGSTISGACTGSSPIYTCPVTGTTTAASETIYAGTLGNTATLTGSPTFTANVGFTGGSSKYVNGPTLNTLTQYTQNAASYSAWIENQRTTASAGYDIYFGTAGWGIGVFYSISPAVVYMRVNDAASPACSSSSSPSCSLPANTQGFWMADRTGSASTYLYYNSTNMATQTTASTSLVSTATEIPESNVDDTISEFHVGGDISANEVNFYNLLNTYMGL